MKSIYELKPAFQNLLRPLVRNLANRGVTANQVTVAAMLLSFAAGAVIMFYGSNKIFLLAVPLALFARMALNAIDGMLAREHNMKSDLGVFLNELGDVLSDAAMYLPFALLTGVFADLVVSAVVLAIVVEMAGVIAVMVGRSRRYDGPMGKSDRAFLFGVMALLWSIWGVKANTLINLSLLFIMLPFLLVTLLNRVVNALSEEVKP